MSGQAQEALRIYERMLAAGAQPTATTYTALISAYGKNGQLDKALQIFQVRPSAAPGATHPPPLAGAGIPRTAVSATGATPLLPCS